MAFRFPADKIFKAFLFGFKISENFHSIRERRSMAIFTQVLNPLIGQNDWLVKDDEYDYHQEVANAGFGDMLHDKERNAKYYEALRKTINKMHCRGEVVNVLDIGTGTGILSMMAVKAGADSVTACEVFPPMANCAERIIKANGMADKINLIKKRSTEMIVGVDMPQRANLLVTEVLDTELIGEGAISIYYHAHKELLTDKAICIPSRAKCFAQVVQSSLASMWNTVKVLPSLDGDIILYPSKDIVHCRGEASLHDLQLSQVTRDKFSALTDPIEIFEFDFMNKNLQKQRENKITVSSKQPGTTDMVFFWWSIDLDPSSTIKLSCAPYWSHPDIEKLAQEVTTKRGIADVIPWRDHWMQAAYHIPKPLLINSKDTKFVLSCNHDEYSFWFDAMPVDADKTLKVQRHACTCCFHNTFSRSRIAAMNNAPRNKVFLRYLEQNLTSDSNILVLGDGCLVGLAAAKLGAKSVIIYESDRLSRKFMDSLVQHNHIDNVKIVDRLEKIDDSKLENVTHVFAEPYFMNSILPWDNLYFGTLINRLKAKLPSNLKICPQTARLYACPVEFLDLYKIRKPVGNCEGFDLSLFDEMVNNSRSLTHAAVEPHALWEYPTIALAGATEILTVTFDKYETEKCSKHELLIETDGMLNGMAIWMDFNVDESNSPTSTITTGPIESILPGSRIKWNMYSRQGVHFFQAPQNVCNKSTRIECTVDFKPINGKLNLKFEISN